MLQTLRCFPCFSAECFFKAITEYLKYQINRIIIKSSQSHPKDISKSSHSGFYSCIQEMILELTSFQLNIWDRSNLEGFQYMLSDEH